MNEIKKKINVLNNKRILRQVKKRVKINKKLKYCEKKKKTKGF